MTQRQYTHTTGKPSTTKSTDNKVTKMEVLGVLGLFAVLGVMLAIALFAADGSSIKEFTAKWGIAFAVPTYLLGCGIYCALKGDSKK